MRALSGVCSGCGAACWAWAAAQGALPRGLLATVGASHRPLPSALALQVGNTPGVTKAVQEVHLDKQVGRAWWVFCPPFAPLWRFCVCGGTAAAAAAARGGWGGGGGRPARQGSRRGVACECPCYEQPPTWPLGSLMCGAARWCTHARLAREGVLLRELAPLPRAPGRSPCLTPPAWCLLMRAPRGRRRRRCATRSRWSSWRTRRCR